MSLPESYPYIYIQRCKSYDKGILYIDIYKGNPKASFGFIGANCENEDTANTKRYRVYNKLVATRVSNEIFKHVEDKRTSAYMLVNRKELEEYPDLIEKIEKSFMELYDYFD